MHTIPPANPFSFLTGGGQMGQLIGQQDWTATPLGDPQQWPVGLRIALANLLHSAFPMFLLWGADHICFYNDAFRPSLGHNGKHPHILGQPGQQAWPETWDFISPLIEQVKRTGQPVWYEDQQLAIYRNGRLEEVYWTFSYSPAYQESGDIGGVLVTCTETTQQVRTRQGLHRSEQRFQNLVRDAPVGIIVLSGEQLQVSIVNQAYGRLIDRPVEELLHQPLFTVIPEAEAVFRPLIEGVRQSGQPLYLYDQSYAVGVKDAQKQGFLNLVYQPYKEPDGTITGVMVLCQEVTQQVVARLALEQQERALRNAVELAELGTWTLDVGSGHTQLSARHATMFGLNSLEMPYETALSVVHPQDRDRVGAAFAQALQPNSGGRYQAEYRILNARTGQLQVIRARGELSVDEGGKRQMAGVAQDVTLERALQATLEQQVQRQTEEIAAANEELAALNEELTSQNDELAALNEELAEANQLLMRSNENLQTFAYVASHDLQEPLRKIQQFGDLLKTRYGDSVGDALVYLERMQSAARRMSTLIKDLLDYSRLSTQQVGTRWASLQEVVEEVLSTLELSLQETGAQVSLEPLPTVMGDASQLNQLVQNLLANALKFRRPGVSPRIAVKASRVSADHLPEGLTLSRNARGYHRIDIVDNGIGFEEKYRDRIFQVFQRLHGKSEYAGTGIGLAICEKVVTNHGGAITASSQPGQGATFTIYLPA